MSFRDLGRCYEHTIADERLRLRYVALKDAIVEILRATGGASIDVLAERLGCDRQVVADEVRVTVIAHGLARWSADDVLRPVYASR